MATTYNTNGFGITPGTGLTDYVTPFATTQGRLDTVVGSCPNVLGYKSGANWYAALGDGNTNDSTAINAILEAVNAAGGGYVYFPFKPDGYLIGTSLKKYANTSWIGDRTILIGAAGLTGSVVEVQDDHYAPGTTLYASQIFMKGFYINCDSVTDNNLAIIRCHNYTLHGQIFEELFLKGRQASTNVAGIRIFGESPKYFNVFRHITFWICHSPSGAFHLASGIAGANTNLAEFLTFYNCWTEVGCRQCDGITLSHGTFPQNALGGITQSSGVVTGGRYPRIRMHNSKCRIEAGYFDAPAGEVMILATFSGEQYQNPTVIDDNCIGINSTDQVLHLTTNSMFDEMYLITYVDASTFKIPYNYASTFTAASQYWAWSGSAWVQLTIGSSAYANGWTTVTVSSANVPAGINRIAASAAYAIDYVSDTQITAKAAIPTWPIQVHGKKLYLIGQDDIKSVHVDYGSGSTYYLINDTLGPGAAFTGCHSIASDPTVLGHMPRFNFDTYDQRYLKTKTTDWIELKLHENRHTKVDLNTVGADIIFTGPCNTVSEHAYKFSVTIVGHNTITYNVGWRGSKSAPSGIVSSISSVPMGWTAHIEFLYIGNRAFPTSEILTRSYYLSNYDPGNMTAGATDVHDVVFANTPGFLETDKIACSYGQGWQRYKLKTEGVLKGGTTDTITVTITNIGGVTYNPLEGALFIDVIRTL